MESDSVLLRGAEMRLGRARVAGPEEAGTVVRGYVPVVLYGPASSAWIEPTGLRLKDRIEDCPICGVVGIVHYLMVKLGQLTSIAPACVGCLQATRRAREALLRSE